MEADKEKLAEALSNRTAKTYRQAYRNLISEIDALYAEMLDKGFDNVTRTEIYRLNHYQTLANKIATEVEGLTKVEVKELDALLESISFTTYKANCKELGIDFSIINEREARNIARQNWSGMNFTSRAWKNAEDFSSRVLRDVEDMIINGKSPSQLKKQLMKDFNARYYEADRLVRTEASHAFNSANLESYKKAGCKVKYLAEEDCCDICELSKDLIFDADDPKLPDIPQHPNCRCAYSPVVEL